MLEKKIVLFLLFNSTPFNGTKYVFGEIVAVNQIDSQDGNALTAPAEPLSVPVSEGLLCMDASAETIVPATHIVLMSNDDNEESELATKVVPIQEEVIPPAVKVTFMNGSETVATLTAENGAVVAPTAPTPGADALISKYEFVGWTDTDGTATYAVGASIPATVDVTLYAKYQMYTKNDDTILMVYGDITGDGIVKSKDRNELIYYFKNQTRCDNVDKINKPLDSANMSKVFGDIKEDDEVNCNRI